MDNNFRLGFEKTANAGAKAGVALGALGLLGGLGAMGGHMSHVERKMDAARRGKEDKEDTFIKRHPKTMGALSLGIAPSASTYLTKLDRDNENANVRKVVKKHPLASRMVQQMGR